jgi:hypothetical protein
VNEAPHGERETLPGRYCFHQKSKNLEWTTRGVGFGDLWHGCYASLDTCRQQAREYSRNYGEVVCIEATELWCYYVWERDEKGKETGRPDRCSQRRSLCESDRRWALSRTPTPTPERVGRIAVSGECGLLKDRQ